MTSFNAARVLALSVLLCMAAATCLAQPIASGDLEIRGMALEIVETSVSVEANTGTPSYVQTRFGGGTDDATVAGGFVAEGDLVGPGIDTPITLRTPPGHRFEIPGLPTEGEYYLQRVRLVRSDGTFLSDAIPSVASIRVSSMLLTEVKMRQLTSDELRARGIVLDSRNFECWQVTATFYVEGKAVVVEYPVVIDPTTREIRQVVGATPYNLPPIGNFTPPRWTPPAVVAFDLDEPVGDQLPSGSPTPFEPTRAKRSSIPAALVLSGNLAVLHQFFSVGLNVANGASPASTVRLEAVSARLRAPSQVRIAKTSPSVAPGQPVPLRTADGGSLEPQQQAAAEWTVEGLATGTHMLDVDVQATMTQPGQPDQVLSGTKSAAVVIHDPRFNISFAHPATVEAAVDWSSDSSVYSAWAFVTNTSPSQQTVGFSTGIPTCSGVPQHLCLADGASKSVTLDLSPGQTKEIEYRLKSSRSGSLFASAASSDSGAVGVSLQLLGGENYSPATLLMPWYARFLDQNFVNANLQLLGRGFGVATASLTSTMAGSPRVIKTDVFMRAIDIARAGQRSFITDSESDPAGTRAGKRFAYSNLALDLLGARDGRRREGEAVEHRNALQEWDALRRMESENNRSGRTAGAALALQLESTLEPGESPTQAFDRFVAAGAHRSDFVVALVTRGNARLGFVSPSGATVGANVTGAHPYSRRVPFADIHRLRMPDATDAELGIIGHSTTNVEVVISADGPVDLELVFPGGDLGAPLRVSRSFSSVGSHTYTLRIANGVARIDGHDETGLPLTITSAAPLAVPPIEVLAARQDLYLDTEGHKVSLLFNRPVLAGDGELFRKFGGEVVFADGSHSYRGPRPISAAALQEDGRVVNLTFDHALHANVAKRPGCAYSIAPAGMLSDPIEGAGVTSYSIPAARIDNARPAALLYGQVIAGDGMPITGADVVLYSGPPQYDRSNASAGTAQLGSFFFEYVPRDPQNGYSGAFTLEAITTEGKSTSTSGTIRTPGAVYAIDLQFLGRGSAEGYVRYDDSNAAVAGARVVVGSRMFNQFRTTTTDTSGFYRVTDVPVGPLTFSATDAEGNVVYAAGEIAASGQVVERNLLIHRQPFPGVGAVRGIVRRSDGQNDPVPGAHVGVYSQGYGLIDGYTDADGRFEFTAVPAGSVSVLAEEWTVAYESAAIELDLRADETREVTLIIPVRNTSVALGRVEGVVTRGDAGVIGARPVPGAVVQIDGFPAVTADASGRFTFESVPLTFSTRRVRAWDPESGRIGESHLPTLRSDATNNAPIFIPAASGAGRGTVRVLLLDAGGAPVSSDEYKVLLTGYPVVELRPESETGVFTVVDVPVGTTVEFAAVPRTASGRYGEQFVSGSASVDIDQQIVSRTLRLPGQGQVLVSLQSAGTKQLGDVRLEFRAWSEAEQDIAEKVVLASTQDPPGSGIPGYARFARVPAQQTVTVSADLAAQGSASQALRLAWDGQVLQSDLQLGTRARGRGRVLHFDGLTPIVGASVAIVDGLQDSGVQVTGEHGSFEFADVPPGIDFRLTASWYENDVYRTGVAGGRTPELGGLVEGLVITLRRQANVEGRIVFADRKVDPADPSRMVPDDTPGDYSDNAPVARGSFWLTELDFPNRSFGSQGSPLRADLEGNFVVANVFEGSFRVTASNLDQSASVSGRIDLDGVSVTALLAVGAEGSGTIDVRVVDPDRAYVAVPNAEITLYRNGEAFDFGSSDGAGNARFGELPATGSYQVGVYSKALGRSGASDAFTIQPGVGRIVEVALERSGTVAGTLTDSAYSGEGVVGAHVSLTGMGYGTRTTTADGGAFEFDGVREGLFRLETRDPLSNRRAYGQGEISQGQPRDTVDLQLPRWSSLRVNTWLPDDYGARSSTPAGSVAVDVRQLCYFSQGDGALICEELRSLQGASLLFDRVLPDADYLADVREIGGSGRKVSLSGRLNEGESKQHDVVLPAFGRVNVRVLNRDTRAPMENVRVQVSSEGTNFVGYTDSSGSVLAGSFILNREVSVGAATVDGRLSGSTRVTILRSSVPADATIELASYATISGYVEAEEGGPSIGTRVVAQGSAETVTDGAGRFGIAGLVTGTSINLVYLGPDGLTVGARQQFTPAVPGVNLVPSVRLDATPPRIVAVNPVDGAAEVSLDTRVEVVFSEPIAPAYHSATYFQLAPNGTGTGTGVAFSTFTEARGFVVTLIPSQKLASHTLYRLLISGSVADMSGHAVGAPREVSFTTSDRTEPQILRVSPDASRPIPANSLFEVELNEALNSLDWQAGGSGRMTLSKLAGMPSAPVATIDGVVWLDEPTHRTLRFSPSTLLEAASTYRLELSGVRDLQGNLLAAQAFDFATADAVKPHISIATPSPAEALVGGLLYTTGLVLRDGDANGPAAEDIDRVEYFQRSGDTWQLAQIVRRTAGNPNCSYSFVVPTSSPSFALRAVAFDTSFNESLPAEVAWEVVADEAPRNVNIVTKIGGMLSASAHAGSPVVANLTFEEEGFVATYTIRAVATKDGQPLFASAPQSAEMRRAPGDGWSTVTYEFVLPKTLPAGTIVTVGATVNDSSNRAGTGEATISILEDSGKPAVVLVSEPAPGGSVSDGGIVRVRATGADVEVGVATVRAILGARTVSLTRVGSGDEFAGEIIAPDVSGVEAVPFDLGVEAEDYAGNVSARTVVPLTVTPVYDPTDPVISFVCGTDGAVLPVGVSFSVLVDVKPGAAAGSDPANAISSVVFRVNGDERRLDPSASNRYSTSISTVGMADGSVVRVEVEARTSGTGSGARAWEIPVVEAVDLTGHVIEADDPRYESRSIFVNGGSLTIIGRHTFANVIVLGGAMPSSVKTNPASLLEFSSSNVYVGCGASIDVDDLGSEPVPLDGSPGSYGGYGAGGQRSTYGSLVKPRSFGNGGGVNPVFRGLPQNNAGGAVSLTAARFVLDGQLRANGSDTHGDAGGGSGGSVHLQVGDLVLGLDGAIAANGARGGGGGRVAVHATNSIQASYAQIAARG
ncbi:MAG: Ig-like domain-containing protein, partial [Thermoanaerobaculia bacterium]|nr:Ig-like domain-containing protein [Thermoanaerobaculia bacterium]